MTLEQLHADLEADRAWRENDLRFLENQLLNAENEEKEKTISKPLILLLYANFEGYTKFMFQAYVNYINGKNLNTNDVVTPLAASNLNKVFEEFKNHQRKPKKNKIFKTEHPKEFVELGRRIEFLNNFEYLSNKIVKLDSSKMADTESNLTKTVLNKIIFRLGFDETLMQNSCINSLDKLLNYRNSIAHGYREIGWKKAEYYTVKNDVNTITRYIRQEIVKNISERQYMKETIQSDS